MLKQTIESLFDSAPQLFEAFPLPDDWLDDWIVTRADSIGSEIENPNSLESTTTLNSEDILDKRFNDNSSEQRNYHNDFTAAPYRPYEIQYRWPATPDFHPPSDAFAFYVPFHSSVDKHGIYLLDEGIDTLSRLLVDLSENYLNYDVAQKAAKAFTFYHEVYHHKIEMFATRIEIASHKACYISAAKEIYKEQTKSKNGSMEETLANVHGYDKALELLKKKGVSKSELGFVADALVQFIKRQPKGYSHAAEILESKSALKKETFRDYRNLFLAQIKNQALNITDDLWDAYLFDVGGFDQSSQRINGPFNYLLPKSSPLSRRINLIGRKLTSREFLKKAKSITELKATGKGKGSHEVYLSKNGGRTTVPKNKDLPMGTVRSMLKQLGIDMSVSEFLRM